MGFLLVAFVFLIIFIGMFFVIKRRWIAKRLGIYSAQFTAQNIYAQFQNRQKKNAIEHVLYRKEEKNSKVAAMI